MELQLNQKRFVSVKEAAELFSIGTKSMYQYAKDGEGQNSVSVGSRWLISPDKFEEYLLNPITELREELETNKNEQGVRFVTCKVATQIFSISAQNVRRFAERDNGRFAFYLGDRWLISPERFEEFLLEKYCEKKELIGEAEDE